MGDSKKLTPAALARGYELLFASGVVGMRVGFLTGAASGAFLVIIGVFYGMIFGLPAGFCAAVFAIAKGGRHSCARFGALFGGIGGVAALVFFSPDSRGISWSVFTDNGPIGLALALVLAAGAAFAGYLAGTYVDPRLRMIPGYSGMFQPLAVTLDQSDFYQLPLTARLGLAFVLTAPMCVAMPWVMRFVYSFLRPFGYMGKFTALSSFQCLFSLTVRSEAVSAWYYAGYPFVWELA